MESRDIERVLREMLRTFEEKNALYGNSFEESLREWGALVGVSRNSFRRTFPRRSE